MPTLPWSGLRKIHLEREHCFLERLVSTELKVEWNEEDRENVTVPMEIYERACVTNAKDGVEVGAPLIFISIGMSSTRSPVVSAFR